MVSLRQVLTRTMAATGDGGNPFDEITHGDPEKNEYLRELIDGILVGRRVGVSYNVVVLAAVLGLSALHFLRTKRDRRRWRERVDLSEGKGLDGASRPLDDREGEHSSSSSTLFGGAATPPDSKQTELDLEQRSLLDTRRPRPRWRLSRTVKGWLTYQPQPIPIINRQLPSNGTSLFVLAWLGPNVFLHLYRLPLETKYLFVFADRCGYMFIVNLPLLYLLAAKTQPLRVLTGRSYEALNIFHRRLGEMMCLEGAVHMISMIVWRFVLEPEWLLAGNTTREYLLHPLILEGFGALVSYELLYFTSLGSFRQRWYELFLASHIVLQVLALVFLWFHFHTSRPYVALSLAIFLVDRLIWRLTLKSFTTTADLIILEDGETLMLSADWDIPTAPTTPPSKLQSLFQHNILTGWSPTDHVFLTIPALGRTHSLQSHPFTIASAAPPIPPWTFTPPTHPTHAWLNLLIRSHEGFTASLLHHALLHPSTPLSIRLDGPYGSPHALSMLRAVDTAILVAGGSGIAVVYPLAEALLLHGRTGQRVKMLWVVHSIAHKGWIPEERLRELVDAGLELVVPEPTGIAGRPDVSGIVGGWIGDAEGEVGVVVSGPDGMNRVVRNVCAEEIGEGVKVRVAVEKFGW